jgi:hypothetical protein
MTTDQVQGSAPGPEFKDADTTNWAEAAFCSFWWD